MSRRLLVAAGAGTSFAAPPVAITVEFAWVGAVTDTTATVKARCADASSITLAITGHTAVSGTEGSDEMWTFNVTGLTAGTSYVFGFPGSSYSGTIKTLPVAGSQASFTIAAASCAGHPGVGNAEYITGAAQTSDSPAFDRIRDRAPAMFIHMGDLHYRDISTASAASFRTAFRDVLANARQEELYRTIPLAYVWDDHDYGPNDSDGTAASKPSAQQVYREYVPHYSLPSGSSIYQTFVIGRVRFILLDNRSERSPNSDPDTSSKTMLGATQKAWLKALVVSATEPVIVLVTVNAWSADLSDEWGSFGTERQELAEYFEDNGVTDKLLIMHGDVHALVGDDGTNTQYDPGSANPGPPLVGFAPLDGGATTIDGTYSEGSFLTRHQQYGTISFVDAGATITATMKGWAVNGASESEVFSFDHVFSV